MNPLSVLCLILLPKVILRVSNLDYTNIFSPVVKATIVRVLLFIAVTNKWHLRQLDVKNVFLNGTLIECVHMEQPPSILIIEFPLISVY